MYTNMHRQVVMPVSGLFCTFSLAYDCVLLLVLVDSVSCFFLSQLGINMFIIRKMLRECHLTNQRPFIWLETNIECHVSLLLG